MIEETVAEPKAYNENIKVEAPPFKASDIPEYNGSPYAEINNNVPFFTDHPDSSFAIYSPLDNLGRCGVTYANISKDLMPTEKRGEIGSIRPSGWHTVKYNDLIKDLYLYNRCHLIGYQLTGENANERNLITGTRYMNTEGMEPFESRVANYISSRNAHVLYRVTPIFDGNDLLARGVLMEAYSTEDDGTGICFCVFCYNVQPGIGINYADGDSWVIEETVTEAVTTEPEPVTEPEAEPEIIKLEPVEQQEPIEREMPSEEKSQTYILNTNTKKFHYPSCSSVNSMKDKNKQEYTGSRDDIIAMGYDPCKKCYP
ncbi:MAG: DNA/RNA non-specific endonuclease [Oscillospiraceae bacterium]|nr:DNA/RNA non-specific endonuclease [Oscillospiraceae bacterium]